jgi:large subunit ribosomal protein L19
MNLVDKISKKYANPNVENFPDFRPGDTIGVHVKIKEGEKTRIQLFKGTCIAMKERKSTNGHFYVRKMSDGVGVERIFPFHCPSIEKVEILSKGKSRRAKHFYLRDRTGKEARIAIDFTRK